MNHDSQSQSPSGQTTIHVDVNRFSFRSWASLGLAALVVGAILVGAAFIPEASSSVAVGSLPTHKIARGELLVSVTEQGTLESANNTEIKCKVRGDNTLISVIESGTEVEAGDELVRLETLLIEEEISERTKFAHLARSAVARAEANVARAEIAISQYLKGRFVTELSKLQKELAVAESNFVSAKNMLSHTKMMAESEYTSELNVEEKQFAVEQADLQVKLTNTRIDVLKRFKKQEELATLEGDLNAARANHAAEKERALADEMRLRRAEEELVQCVVKAERSGVVIYPSGKAWEDSPDIEEGATVHKDQVLLLMPDLDKMQVKVGIHESVIDRVQPGLPAKVTLPNKSHDADVSSVASVAEPAGWWTGNVVKYETIVKLPKTEGLRPGMSVEVEVVLARHKNVLLIPTSAVIATQTGHACWVRRMGAVQRRSLELGDNSDMFIVVESGLLEGDEVVLDPLAPLPAAQAEAAESVGDSSRDKPKSVEL